MEDATMPGVKKASKRKHVTKAVPVLGAAGLTFSLAGGASASAVPTSDVPPKPNIAPSHEITLGEEEIADEHTGFVVAGGVDRFAMPPQTGLVQHVVVHQRGRVNHLDHGGQHRQRQSYQGAAHGHSLGH
jgi:hypothetical protein